jgi:hypothetical protein
MAVGCSRTDGRPPVHVEAAHGSVYARTPELARDVAVELDAGWEALHLLLPACRDVPVEVWAQEKLRGPAPEVNVSHAKAYSMPERGRIVLHESRDGRHNSLVHELFHVLRDTSWEPLPKYVQEGVASLVAQEIVPDERGRWAEMLSIVHRFHGTAVRVVQSAPDGPGSAESIALLVFNDPLLDAAELDRVITQAQDPSTISSLDEKACGYAIGHILARRIVERHGFDGLHALCEGAGPSGALSAHELLAAAGLPADPDEWWSLIAPELGDAEAQSYAVLMVDPLAKILRLVLPEDAYERVLSGRIELHLTDAARTRLADVPKLVDALRLAH